MNPPLFELAEYTNRSLFLTGKAGTGKTTFLNELVKKTRKKHIVVAPTGIAAINASGVTIHSMFGLPLRPFLPTIDRIDGHLGNNVNDLLQHFKYRKEKLKLLRELELLIIDEVSMLRADVLDMMDYSLRFVRRSTLPFGGVQMLFIGDLYQLPPVVREQEALSRYYSTPFFFSAKALKALPIITVELTKVYRQSDQDFIDLLNAIRDADLDAIDFDRLNARYDPEFEPKEKSYVYLTSHNRMADAINQKKLEELPGDSQFYAASIVGDFKENQYPCETNLELKVGAQIMFIRNDVSAEKRYFNGKLAVVQSLSEDGIKVIIEGTDSIYTLKKEVWEQKAYSLDQHKNIKEDVLGSFEQYPIRLAWAVTIHKSQGLTFENVIIDAGKSFVSGQVYVALSRCRTLEGIVLKSKITPEVIFSDRRIANFQDSTHANDRIEEILEKEKYDFAISKILQKMDITWAKKEVSGWHKVARESKNIDQNDVKSLEFRSQKEIDHLSKIYQKFVRILPQMKEKFFAGEIQWEALELKTKGAGEFFFKSVHENLFQPFKLLYSHTKGVSGLKAVNEKTKDLLEDFQNYLQDLRDLKLLDTPLLETDINLDLSTKVVKIPSHQVTWQLFKEGKTLTEIEKHRGLIRATLIGHFDKFAQNGTLDREDLLRLLPKEKITIFEAQYSKAPQQTLNEWKTVLPADFEYGEIRLLNSFFSPKED